MRYTKVLAREGLDLTLEHCWAHGEAIRSLPYFARISAAAAVTALTSASTSVRE